MLCPTGCADISGWLVELVGLVAGLVPPYCSDMTASSVSTTTVSLGGTRVTGSISWRTRPFASPTSSMVAGEPSGSLAGRWHVKPVVCAQGIVRTDPGSGPATVKPRVSATTDMPGTSLAPSGDSVTSQTPSRLSGCCRRLGEPQSSLHAPFKRRGFDLFDLCADHDNSPATFCSTAARSFVP